MYTYLYMYIVRKQNLCFLC